jgi:glycosyltransferase involved in cell wall biosynthesis
LPVLVGNPSLLELYPGATVVPHVRVPRPVVAMPQGPLTVAFVGTVRPGKGLDLVRDAVAAVGAGLLITADAPLDARPGERWVGTTTVEEGRAIVEQAHAAAVLSEVGSWRDHQLPVKIVDAMLAGRVVVGSRLAPITWALGDSGLVVDRTHAAIVAALESLQDPATRAAIGDAARERSLSMFTPGAVAPVFERVLATAGR